MKGYDAKGCCPKCGAADISDSYQKGRHLVGHCWEEGEHIHRYCRTCHYEWPEACLGVQE
jgi:predicted amidophosphoribosyltransferase